MPEGILEMEDTFGLVNFLLKICLLPIERTVVASANVMREAFSTFVPESSFVLPSPDSF